MSLDGSTLIDWPDRQRKYRLGIGELRELEETCNMGAAEMCRLTTTSNWRIDHLWHTVRLGLIGGGLDANRAKGLTARYVTPGRLMEVAVIAQKILLAALVGDETTPAPKGEAEETKTMDGTTSRTSTEAEPSSAGPHDKSINARSPSSLPQ